MVLLSGNRSIPVYFKVRDIFVVCDSKPEFCLYEGSMQAMAKNLYDVYFGENDIGDVVIQMRPGGVSFQCPLKSSKLTTQEIVKLVNERRREEQSNEANGSKVNPLDKANEVNLLDKANEEWNSNLYSVLSSNQPTEDSALPVERIEIKDVDEYEYEYEYEYEWSQERNESPTTPSSRTPIHPHAISPQFELRERLRRRNASSRYSSSLSLVSSNKQTNKQTNRQASRQELQQTTANNSHPIASIASCLFKTTKPPPLSSAAGTSPAPRSGTAARSSFRTPASDRCSFGTAPSPSPDPRSPSRSPASAYTAALAARTPPRRSHPPESPSPDTRTPSNSHSAPAAPASLSSHSCTATSCPSRSPS